MHTSFGFVMFLFFTTCMIEVKNNGTMISGKFKDKLMLCVLFANRNKRLSGCVSSLIYLFLFAVCFVFQPKSMFFFFL